jgi:uncharacterized membrane protein YfcA
MTVIEIVGLALAAAAAGSVNAVAGGGTLITFPTLLFFGIDPKIANATSTLALVIGTSGSIFGYRRHIEPVKSWLSSFLPVSVVGGLIGGLLLTRTDSGTFARLVPFLILFATLLFLAQAPVRRLFKFADLGAAVPRRTLSGAIIFQFVVSVYGGYFGAGIGILMLAALGFIGLNNIYEMNTLKTILGSVINLVAAIWFIYAGLIDWPRTGVMTLGAMAGYFLGAHYSQQIAPARVRAIITAVGFILSVLTFYQQFLK